MLIEPNLKTVTKLNGQNGQNGHGGHRLRMSYDEFRAWADENVHAEWVNGEVIIFDMATRVHQTIAEFLYYLIKTWLQAEKIGFVHTPPYHMLISGRRAYREPDLIFVRNEHEYRLKNEQLEGAADLVVEVISPDSVKRDREEKFKEYEAAGIPEYWIIDSRRKQRKAYFYTLDETGKYQLFGTEKNKRVDSVIMPGFWLRPTWLWKSDVLDPFHCFVEMMGGREAAIHALFDDKST